MGNGCLTQPELQRYHAGEMSADESAVAERHLADCPNCAERDESLMQRHHSWISRLQAAGSPPRLRDKPSRPLNPLPQLPGYEVRGEISRGGQGIVYRALQVSTRRDVAVKVLRDGLEAAPVAQRRFEREIELVAGLKHPGIVQVFDSGQMRDGRLYVVMDLVEGQRLDEYVRQSRLSLEETLRLFVRVCEAVQHAHQRGVLHRDLKPSNILVTAEGRPVVLDFGLARPTNPGDQTQQTLSGYVAGTLAYLSPEQARGKSDSVDIRSDVYALGVMLYELLCGQMPYPTEEDTFRVLRHIAETSPRQPMCFPQTAPDRAGQRLPQDLETITLMALSKERERRYQAATELEADLLSYLDGAPIVARRDSNLYLLRMLVHRYRAVFGMAAALLVILVSSSIGLGWLYTEQSRQRQIAEAAEQVAEDRFVRLRQLAKAFIQDLDPKIRHIPGTADARAFIVSQALEYLDALMAERPTDLILRLELGSAYVSIGDVQGDLVSSSLDDLPAAIGSYEQALELIEGVLAEAPEHHEALRMLQLTYAKLGDVLGRFGDGDGSFKAHERALELAFKVDEYESDDLRVWDVLGDSHERMGNKFYERGAFDKALEHYEQSMRYALLCNDARHGEPWARRAVGVAHTKLAQVKIALGDRKAGLEHYATFLVMARELADLEPENRVARVDLAAAHEWHCILLTELNRAEEAVPHCEAAVQQHDRLLQIEPDNRKLLEGLGSKLTKHGEALLKVGRHEDARVVFERLVQVGTGLVEHSTHQPHAQRLLAVGYYKLYEYHKALAGDTGRTRGQRITSWGAAETELVRCQAVFQTLEECDLLFERDAGTPALLKLELAILRSSREALERAAD